MIGVRQAIAEILEADSQLTDGLGDGADGIYHQVAPQDAALPVIILYQMGGEPKYTFGDFHDEEEWCVKAVNRDGDAGPVEVLSDRVSRLLYDAELDIDGETLWCRRERDVTYSENREGTVYHHVGAIYGIYVLPAP